MIRELTEFQYRRICQEFGEALKGCRDHAGQTQAEFGERVDVGPSTVSRWEKGRGLPRAKTLYKLAKWMGISVDYLFGLAHDRYTEQHKARHGRSLAG